MAFESPWVVLPVSPGDGVQFRAMIQASRIVTAVHATAAASIVSQVKSFSRLFHFF